MPLLQAAKGYDYVVLGATRETRVSQRFTGGNTTMIIAERTDTPVLLLHPETSPARVWLAADIRLPARRLS